MTKPRPRFTNLTKMMTWAAALTVGLLAFSLLLAFAAVELFNLLQQVLP